MSAAGHGHARDEIIMKVRVRGLHVDDEREMDMRNAINLLMENLRGREVYLDIHESLSEDGLYSEGDIWIGEQLLTAALLDRNVVRIR